MVAGGRSAAETPGGRLVVFRILEGCQSFTAPEDRSETPDDEPVSARRARPRRPSL